jgi:uncharacterized protein
VIRPSHAMRKAQAKGTYAITDEQIAAQEKLEKDQADGNFDDGEGLPGFSLGKPDGDEQGGTGKAEKEAPSA